MRRRKGMDTVTVAAEATNAMAIALNEKAVGSLRAKAAVPKPCAAAPMLKPRATGSVIPQAVRILAPKLAPTKPVNTTMDTAKETSAPNKLAMAMASGEVMLRDNKLKRTAGIPMPHKRTASAVAPTPPKVAPLTAVATARGRADAADQAAGPDHSVGADCAGGRVGLAQGDNERDE